jgi:hypothetical protein
MSLDEESEAFPVGRERELDEHSNRSEQLRRGRKKRRLSSDPSPPARRLSVAGTEELVLGSALGGVEC